MSVRSDPSFDATAIYVPLPLQLSTVVALGFVVASIYRVPLALIPLGIFVLFLAPGFGAAALLFGRRAIPSYAANLAIIVGLSVIINVAAGTVLLYYTIGPIDPILGSLAAVLCFLASLVQSGRTSASRPSATASRFWASLRLPGFSRGQRAAVYVLFVAVLLTFGAIGYLAALQPGNTPDLSMTVVGPDGTTSTLPLAGTVNATLAVVVQVTNNATVQALVLTVNSTLIGVNGTNLTSVPWAMPLPLSPPATSAEPLQLTRGESASVSVSFQFGSIGDYVVSFSLTPPSSTVPVRTTSISVVIT